MWFPVTSAEGRAVGRGYDVERSGRHMAAPSDIGQGPHLAGQSYPHHQCGVRHLDAIRHHRYFTRIYLPLPAWETSVCRQMPADRYHHLRR